MDVLPKAGTTLALLVILLGWVVSGAACHGFKENR
jgi:hypothetical protein